MSQSNRCTSEKVNNLHLQFPASFHSPYDCKDDSDLWPVKQSSFSSFNLSSTRSNRASSSILPDLQDHQPCQCSHRDTLRLSLVNSDIVWLYGPAIDGLKEIESHQSPEHIAKRSRSSQFHRRQPSFLSKNISLRQNNPQGDEKLVHGDIKTNKVAPLNHHLITFEITKPELTHGSNQSIAIADTLRTTYSPSDYLHFDSTTSSPHLEERPFSIDPFSIAHGIIEFADVPTPVELSPVYSRRLSRNEDVDFYDPRCPHLNHSHRRELSSPTCWRSGRYEIEPLKQSRWRRHAYSLTMALLLLLLAIACLATGFRLRSNS